MAPTAHFGVDFTSFHAAVQKAEVTLRGFEGDANRVTKSLTAMSNSLNGTKVIQDATLMARAVERIGGISKLTESELARLGAQASEAAEKMRKMGIGVPANLQNIADAADKAGKSLNGVSGWFSSLGTQVASTAAGFISAQAAIGLVQTGFRTLVGFVSDSVKSFAAAEAAQAKLTTAMKQQGTATDVAIGSLNDLATEFQRTTIYSDDLVTEMEALLVQVGNVMPQQMDRALQASANLASGLGVDLQTATTLVAKAAAGHTETLGRYGITVDEAALKTKGFDAVLEQINKQFGGQAAAALDTYAGKVEKLGNDWDNFKEAVGKAIANDPVIQRSLRELSEAADQASKSEFGLRDAMVKVANYAPGLGPILASIVNKNEELAISANAAAAAQSKLAREVKQISDSRKQTGAEYSSQDINRINAAARAIDEATRATVKKTEAVKADTRAIDQAREASERFRASVVNLTSDAIGAAKGFGVFGRLMPELTGDTEHWREQMVLLSSHDLPDLKLRLQDVGRAGAKSFEEASVAARTFGDSMRSLFSGDFKSLFGDIGSFFKGGLGKVGTGILEGFGNIISGGITSLISKGFGFIADGVSALFGKITKSEGKKVNDLRDAFQKTFGTFDDMAAAARRAGVDLAKLLDTKKVKDFEREMQALKDAIEFQDNAMRTLDDTVKKYGFTLEELGPALQRAQLDKKAQELYQDFKVLTGGGIEAGAVIGRMSDEINQFIHDALKTGTEVPAAMKPMLQRMADMGLLTDEAGNVITDLGASGITFAETMTQGFDRVVKSVDKLVQAIARGLGIAIDTVGDQLDKLPDEIDIDIKYRTPRDPILGFGEGPEPVYPMASGGVGRVTKPTLFLAGEAGPEDYAFSGANRSLSGGGAPISVSVGQVTIQAGDSDDPKSIADKFIEALRTQSALYQGIAVIADRRISVAT